MALVAVVVVAVEWEYKWVVSINERNNSSVVRDW